MTTDAKPDVETPAVFSSSGIVEFNARCYVDVFADVKTALADGTETSAVEHYTRVGRIEGRLVQEPYLLALSGGMAERAAHHAMSFNIDVMMLSDTGTLFVVGWSDDREVSLLSISAIQVNEGWNTRSLARCRRPDVEELLGCPAGYTHGFWLLHKLGRCDPQSVVMLRARFADGRFMQRELKPKIVNDIDLQETVLGHFASLKYPGNRDIECAQQLEAGAGRELVEFNRSISKRITGLAHVERYGPTRKRFTASFIVCLFGKLEYFFLQNALFVSGYGVEQVEFIYVSNSPELTEALQKEARIAEKIYGLSITMVTLPGNAGFSGANNAAARFARSDRLVFINPDVFPRDDKWARKHGEIVSAKSHDSTALFGVPLYYDDGSLMHGGMYFEIDRGLSVKTHGIQAVKMIRVEHYGKGAPVESSRYTRERPVPAVTGAFISTDRSWFEELGGFTEDYLFGHYEDADLCLKSLQRGKPAWIHDIRFWHLEGKGSIRRHSHEGGSLVNRWLFTSRWGSLIEGSLDGRNPHHPLLNRISEQISVPMATAPSIGNEPPAPVQEAVKLIARTTLEVVSSHLAADILLLSDDQNGQ